MSGVVPVVQADRDASAEIYRWYFGTAVAQDCRDGKLDSERPVQSHARHRIAETARLEAEIERLRGALEPFAEEANDWLEDTPDNRAVFVTGEMDCPPVEAAFTVGDLRAARTALAADTGER